MHEQSTSLLDIRSPQQIWVSGRDRKERKPVCWVLVVVIDTLHQRASHSAALGCHEWEIVRRGLLCDGQRINHERVRKTDICRSEYELWQCQKESAWKGPCGRGQSQSSSNGAEAGGPSEGGDLWRLVVKHRMLRNIRLVETGIVKRNQKTY